MATEKVHETVIVSVIARDDDYDSLTGKTLTVTAEQVIQAMGANIAIGILSQGRMRLTMADCQLYGWL